MIKKFTSLFPADFKGLFFWCLSGKILSFEFYPKAVFLACSTLRNTGTPEHHGTFRNNRKTRNTTKNPGTPPKNPEHSQENQEHPKKTRNTPKKKPRNLKKQMARQYVTARVSFSKLPPLIANKIIWFDLHNLENIYKRHTGTIFFYRLPGSWCAHKWSWINVCDYINFIYLKCGLNEE